MEKMARFIVKYRFLITLLVLLTTALLGYRVGTMSFQVLLYELFPPKHPYVQLNNKFYQQFGGANGFRWAPRNAWL